MLKRLNWLEGLKSAAFMAAIQFILASGSYLTGCGIFRTHPCSVEIGIKWISAHPVFPNLAPIMILLGFVVGLFVAARVDVEKIASDPQSADVRAGERWQFKFLLILEPDRKFR